MIRYRKSKKWPGYAVGDDGSVWTSKKLRKGAVLCGDDSDWKQLLPMRATGYHCVRFYRMQNGKQTHKDFYIHTLVLVAFTGPRKTGLVCRHRNGVRTDNRLENLEWGTAKENSQDMVRHGRSIAGMRHHNRKLDESSVLAIRAARAVGTRLRVLSAEFGVAESSISRIANHRHWK